MPVANPVNIRPIYNIVRFEVVTRIVYPKIPKIPAETITGLRPFIFDIHPIKYGPENI